MKYYDSFSWVKNIYVRLSLSSSQHQNVLLEPQNRFHFRKNKAQAYIFNKLKIFEFIFNICHMRVSVEKHNYEMMSYNVFVSRNESNTMECGHYGITMKSTLFCIKIPLSLVQRQIKQYMRETS